jgi:protein tyrosine/serine phosphatase
VLVRSLTLYFEALATRDGASLLHCLAGKDRTGLAVALLHRLLGVHEDDVMADYLLTNAAGDQKRRIAAAGDSIRERYGAQITDAAIETLMGVDAGYLHAATRSIADRFGSTERYAEDVLGVDAARREALRERLIA